MNMKTLEETIEYQKKMIDREQGYDFKYPDKREQDNAVLHYLEEYHKSVKTVFPVKQEDVIDYVGTRRIVKIDGEFYLMRRYLKNEGYWMAEKQKWNPDTCIWYNCDDFDYIFDKYGNLVRKEE